MLSVVSSIATPDGKVEFKFKGLSSDTKPAVTYEGKKIYNGSTFMEMNTKKLYYYDEDNSTWV